MVTRSFKKAFRLIATNRNTAVGRRNMKKAAHKNARAAARAELAGYRVDVKLLTAWEVC